MNSPADVGTMMQMYEQSKFWIALVGGLWTVFKAAKWIKEIREVDLVELKEAAKKVEVDASRHMDQLRLSSELQTSLMVAGLKENTASIVREICEMRQDFRTFYTAPTPQMFPAHVKAVKPHSVRNTPAVKMESKRKKKV
jgi:hypothetical protein